MEVADKTFKMWLKKISEEEHKCWVEMIPHVQRKYHGMPGVSGLPPYEIVYGWQRPLAGKVSEDAIEFFKRMESMDKRVAKKLNEEHDRESRIDQSQQKGKASL